MIKKFIKTNDVGYLLGEISDNTLHQHYAVQIVISLNNSIVVKSETDDYKAKSILIKSIQSHQLNCHGQQVLILLINPASKIGHLLNKHTKPKDIQIINTSWIKSMSDIAMNLYQEKLTDENFINAMQQATKEYLDTNKGCFQNTDKRILSALDLLEKNTTEIIPLETIASQVFLSASRFIHLFKKETGITYRRMQLWNKLMASVDDITEHKSITELAHTHGFSDSAHYSRTFKQTFGINPKILFSNVIQK
jgi:AraC-like DNA-binding protein